MPWPQLQETTGKHSELKYVQTVKSAHDEIQARCYETHHGFSYTLGVYHKAYTLGYVLGISNGIFNYLSHSHISRAPHGGIPKFTSKIVWRLTE